MISDFGRFLRLKYWYPFFGKIGHYPDPELLPLDLKVVFVNNQSKMFNKDLISSIDDFLTHVEYLQNSWAFADVLWYRGVSRSSYPLVPGIYRGGFYHLGQSGADDLFNSFIRRGKAFSFSESYTRWHWYQIMQHYGLPTRLLDWTEGALIALFFALRDWNGHSFPCVWALNPYWLNELSTGNKVVFYTDEISQTEEDLVANLYLEGHEQMAEYPIAVLPPHIDDRITAQKGAFTVHGQLRNGLHLRWARTELGQLAQLRISTKFVDRLKSQLLVAGITEATLFPDLEGLARELKTEFGFQ